MSDPRIVLVDADQASDSTPRRKRTTRGQKMGVTVPPSPRTAAAMAWLRDQLPDYASDISRRAVAAGHMRLSLNAARRRLGIRREYVGSDRRPWLVIPYIPPVTRCQFCGSRTMVGPDCDPVTD